MRPLTRIGLLLAAALPHAALSAQPSLETGTVIQAAERLEPGEFLWVPQVAPEGPVMLVVSLATQRAVIYRNGIPIGISTVSTGRRGHRTPTGVFTVLQRHVDHYSNLYNNAPMPHMQRLTWGGIALHGGDIPGYPASHGCIRLPREFARLLYGATRLGMTVVITDQASVPRIAPTGTMLLGSSVPVTSDAATSWQPELSRSGPVSVVISSTDQRLVVVRNGIVIGRAPVTVDGAIERTSAYVLRSAPGAPQAWERIALPGQQGAATPELRGRIHVPDGFRASVESVLRPGSTVVVTEDSMGSNGAGRQMTVVESE